MIKLAIPGFAFRHVSAVGHVTDCASLLNNNNNSKQSDVVVLVVLVVVVVVVIHCSSFV